MTPLSKEELDILREGGKRLANVLNEVSSRIIPGVSTLELDVLARRLIEDAGDRPAFLGYIPEGAASPYPASICVSINDEIVHGIPAKNKIIKEGDVVSIDCGIEHKGLFTDAARTILVPPISKQAQKLADITKEALLAGISAAVAGNKVGDIGHAIESFVKPHGFGIVRELSGHGVGRSIHEDPHIPNFGRKGTGELLEAGMVVAIEPMITLGSEDIVLDKDGYTLRTSDASLAAHFENTIIVTNGDAEVVTE